jgi:hypothetical protein
MAISILQTSLGQKLECGPVTALYAIPFVIFFAYNSTRYLHDIGGATRQGGLGKGLLYTSNCFTT